MVKHKRSFLIIIIGVGVLLITGGLGFYSYTKYQKNIINNVEKDIKDITDSLEERFKEYNSPVEYGTIWKYDEIVEKFLNVEDIDNDVIIELFVNGQIDNGDNIIFDSLRSKQIEIILTKNYKYQERHKDKERKIIVNKVYEVKVEDTVLPEIKGVTDKTIYEGDSINILDGIVAQDIVDGNLDVKYEGNLDNKKEGIYTLKIYAVDKNGNYAYKEMKITVKKKNIPSTSNKNNTSYTKPSTNNSSNNSSSKKTDASTKAGRLALAEEEAKKVIKEIIKPGMSDYEKAEAICNYIFETVERQDNQSSESYKTNFGNEAYAALIMKIAACSGRCKAVMLLCAAAGLTCIHVNANEWTHQWNKVLINGEYLVLDSQIGLFGTTTHPLEG